MATWNILHGVFLQVRRDQDGVWENCVDTVHSMAIHLKVGFSPRGCQYQLGFGHDFVTDSIIDCIGEL